MALEDGVEFVRQGEHDVPVTNVEEVGALALDPSGLRERLTLGAVAIAARGVLNRHRSAVVAGRLEPTERGGAAAHQRIDDALVLCREPMRPPVRALARLFRARDSDGDLPGHADAPSRRARGRLLPRRQGRRRGVHERGRRGPDAVRRASGRGGRPRARTATSSACPNLEALVDTSPVEVVVFDARSGNAVSLNREARRIVETLRGPRGFGGAAPRRDEPPVLRRTRDRSRRATARTRGVQRDDDESEGDRALGPRRATRHDARQRDADLRRGRCGRLRGRHHAGPGPARGTRAHARRVRRHGEPRGLSTPEG